jgi:hypothetical protein
MDRPRRGGCLTTFLVVMLIANPLTAINYWFIGGTALAQKFPHMPAWGPAVLGFGSALNVVFALAAIKWRKWGVYGFMAACVAGAIFNLAIGVPFALSLLGLLGGVILLLLARQQWKSFS